MSKRSEAGTALATRGRHPWKRRKFLGKWEGSGSLILMPREACMNLEARPRSPGQHGTKPMCKLRHGCMTRLFTAADLGSPPLTTPGPPQVR